MESIIFVPGGSGSRLELNNIEIWPPRPIEMMIGYSRLSELQDRNVRATKVIDVISCVDVYKPLQDDLTAIANYLGCNYIDFRYDWRTNIFGSADQLALTVASSVANGATQITLVGHSMGNLVIRALLEGGGHSSETWFNNITRYVGICGPHLGVPRILEFALGQKSYLGIRAQDMKTLSANPDYAACYQCLPFQGQQVLWDFRTNPPQAMDFYDPPTASTFGFNAKNLTAAKDLQQKLKDFGNKPNQIQYILIAGSDQKTDEAIEYEGLNHYWVYPDKLGDGMIPLWSGAIQQFHPQTTPGDHLGIFKTHPFKQILYNVLTNGTLDPQLTLV
ncbi:MAG: esterase/lipase family protein [Xanthobacteraceae bacterium]